MYHLSSSQSERIRFDEMCDRGAVATLQAITVEEALAQDPQQYAELSWDNWHDVENEVDDLVEAKSRYLEAFAQAVKTWQEEKRVELLQDELYGKSTGYVTTLTVVPGGQKDGLNFGPINVEIVVLDSDGDTLAYRVSTDTFDDEWQFGDPASAVDRFIEYQEMVEDPTIT